VNEEGFRRLVRKMRKAQRDYFRTKSRDILEQAKDLEDEVDCELDHEQLPLFDKE
jgi:hypothetical protein